MFTQRPLVHTPGNTSHSLMSAGESTGGFLPWGRFGSQLLAACFYLRRRAPSYEQTPESRWCLRRPEEAAFDSLFGSVYNLFIYLKLTDLAGFAGAPPGRPQRGAALGLQRGSVDVDLAAVVLYRQPAGALHAVCGTTATATTT